MPLPPGLGGSPDGAPPSLPGNPAGGPVGPGSSPALAPGGGSGNEAAADALIKGLMPALYKTLLAYPVGSKKAKAVLNAVRALQSTFPADEDMEVVPAAIQRAAMANRPGGPPTPPPGLAPSKPPMMPPATAGGMPPI